MDDRDFKSTIKIDTDLLPDGKWQEIVEQSKKHSAFWTDVQYETARSSLFGTPNKYQYVLDALHPKDQCPYCGQAEQDSLDANRWRKLKRILKTDRRIELQQEEDETDGFGPLTRFYSCEDQQQVLEHADLDVVMDKVVE